MPDFDDDFEREEQKYKEMLNKITEFLNFFEKDYEIKSWDSGEGVDIIIKCIENTEGYKFKEYNQTLSLTHGGYLTFEKMEEEND